MADELQLQKQLSAAQAKLDAWHQGQTSEHYESGSRGPGTISSGIGDHGGMSYGSYQLSKSTVMSYVRQSSHAKDFEHLVSGSSNFNAKWESIAKKDPVGFKKEQHEFIARTHFDPQVEALKAAGLDLSDRGKAVQDAIWSTSVQFRGKTPNLFSDGLKSKFGKDYKLENLSDKDVIEALQDYKVAHNDSLFQSSSAKVRAGTLHRAHEEKTDLLRLASAEDTVAHNGQRPDWAPAERVAHIRTLHQGQHGEDVKALQNKLNELEVHDAKDQSLKVDGRFNHETTEAVKRFQHDHNMKEDGRVGPGTIKAIDEQVQAKPQPAYAPMPHNPADRPQSEIDLLKQNQNPAIIAFHERVQNEPTLVSYSETDRSRIAAATMLECQRTGINVATLTDLESYDKNGKTMFFANDPIKAERNPYTSFTLINADQAVQTPVQDSLAKMQNVQVAQAQVQSRSQGGPTITM